MTHTQFFTWLTGLTGLVVLIILLLSQWPAFQETISISWISILFFIIFCITVYYMGNRAARNENKFVFARFILILVFIKILACLLIVIVYDRWYEPPSNHYVIPFLLIYLTYTIFEVILLTKANKLTAQDAK